MCKHYFQFNNANKTYKIPVISLKNIHNFAYHAYNSINLLLILLFTLPGKFYIYLPLF